MTTHLFKLIFILISSSLPALLLAEAFYPCIKTDTIISVGHAAVKSSTSLSLQQQKLLAIRAAKLDAYRNLAEQVQGVALDSQASVSNMALQQDVLKSRLRQHLRGAKVVSITPVSADIYEAEVHLDYSYQGECRYFPAQQIARLNTTAVYPPQNPNPNAAAVYESELLEKAATQAAEQKQKADKTTMSTAINNKQLNAAKSQQLAMTEKPQATQETQKTSTQPTDESSTDWLSKQPDNHYTLQIISSSSAEKLQKYMLSQQLGDRGHVLTINNNKQPQYALVYGSFSDKEKAWIEQFKLPISVVENNNIWLRQFKSLKTTSIMKQ